MRRAVSSLAVTLSEAKAGGDVLKRTDGPQMNETLTFSFTPLV